MIFLGSLATYSPPGNYAWKSRYMTGLGVRAEHASLSPHAIGGVGTYRLTPHQVHSLVGCLSSVIAIFRQVRLCSFRVTGNPPSDLFQSCEWNSVEAFHRQLSASLGVRLHTTTDKACQRLPHPRVERNGRQNCPLSPARVDKNACLSSSKAI